MRNSKHFNIKIGGVDYSRYLTAPFTICHALNEQLDYAVCDLQNMRTAQPFKPFTLVELAGTAYRLGIDEVREKIGTGLYTHTLTIYELTKEAERIVMGAKAFTNPAVRDYTDGKTLASCIYTYRSSKFQNEFGVVEEGGYRGNVTASPLLVGTLNIYDDFNARQIASENKLDSYTVTVYFSETDNIKTVEYTGSEWTNIERTVTVVGQQVASFTISATKTGVVASVNANNSGKYLLVYSFDNSNKTSILVEIGVVDEPISKEPYTIGQVVQTLLGTAETLREGLDTPRYQLMPRTNEQAERLNQPAPEFKFSNGRTLAENLREVGKYIHAIPRIELMGIGSSLYYAVRFDDLGQIKQADLSKGKRVAWSGSFNMGDYTAGVDSMASNLMNVTDDGFGSISAPFAGGFKSLRTATQEARVQEGSAIISTEFPIEKVTRLEVIFDDYGETVDITPYIFEKTEYEQLSSYSGGYPYSKTYAIFYSQGAPNIDGLWYKANDSSVAIVDAFKEYSITNVIKSASTQRILDIDYTKLKFRVTYVPSVTARVRQFKQSYEGDFPSVMTYNQSAQKLSSKAFGENLRGRLAMLGTTSDNMTYVFPNLEDVPKAGELYGEMDYLSTISTRVYGDFVISQIGLSTGYNELGGYVDLDNQIRLFEIPDGQERFTAIDEFCIIGADIEDDTDTIISESVKTAIKGVCGYSSTEHQTATATLVMAETFDENGESISGKLALPVVSMPLGTSLYYGFKFADNFSAGARADKVDGKAYLSQTYVRYGDQFYATAYSLGFDLFSAGVFSATEYRNETAHTLPNVNGLGGIRSIGSTGDHRIIWYKDSADAGCISYQLHFMTNDGIIIGDGLPALAMSHELESRKEVKVFFFDHKINPLGVGVPESGAVYETTATATATGIKIDANADSLPPFKAWAIFVNGRFTIGKNTSDFNPFVYFNFKRRI